MVSSCPVQEWLTISFSQWGTSSSQKPCTLGVPRPAGRWRWYRLRRRPRSTSRLCCHHQGAVLSFWPLQQWQQTSASRWKVARTGPQTAALHTGQTLSSPLSPCCGSSKKEKKGGRQGWCCSETSPCPSQGWTGLRPVNCVPPPAFSTHDSQPWLSAPPTAYTALGIVCFGVMCVSGSLLSIKDSNSLSHLTQWINMCVLHETQDSVFITTPQL